MIKHRHFSPDCAFVVNPNSSGNIPITSTNSNASSDVASSDLMNEQNRLATFHNWPVSDLWDVFNRQNFNQFILFSSSRLRSSRLKR